MPQQRQGHRKLTGTGSSLETEQQGLPAAAALAGEFDQAGPASTGISQITALRLNEPRCGVKAVMCACEHSWCIETTADWAGETT
jgi:hypothetical protein